MKRQRQHQVGSDEVTSCKIVFTTRIYLVFYYDVWQLHDQVISALQTLKVFIPRDSPHAGVRPCLHEQWMGKCSTLHTTASQVPSCPCTSPWPRALLHQQNLAFCQRTSRQFVILSARLDYVNCTSSYLCVLFFLPITPKLQILVFILDQKTKGYGLTAAMRLFY